MSNARRIFLDVHAPAPGAAPEQITVTLTRPDVVYGRHPEPDGHALHNAHRLLGTPTFGMRSAGTIIMRRMDGLSLPAARHVHRVFFFTHV